MSLPIKKVQDIVNQHSKLEKDLSKNKIQTKLYAEKSKENSKLNERNKLGDLPEQVLDEKI